MYREKLRAFFKWVIFMSLMSGACLSHADISVIVLEKNKTKWTRENVRYAYLGKKESRSELIEQASGQALHVEFRERFLQVGENQIKLQWSKRIFSGERAPTVKADDHAVYEYVKSVDDAIGYVSTVFFERADRAKEGVVELFQIK